MLTQINGTWYVQMSETPVLDWGYWFQQAAIKNGTLAPDIKRIPKPKVLTETQPTELINE